MAKNSIETFFCRFFFFKLKMANETKSWKNIEENLHSRTVITASDHLNDSMILNKLKSKKQRWKNVLFNKKIWSKWRNRRKKRPANNNIVAVVVVNDRQTRSRCIWNTLVHAYTERFETWASETIVSRLGFSFSYFSWTKYVVFLWRCVVSSMFTLAAIYFKIERAAERSGNWAFRTELNWCAFFYYWHTLLSLVFFVSFVRHRSDCIRHSRSKALTQREMYTHTLHRISSFGGCWSFWCWRSLARAHNEEIVTRSWDVIVDYNCHSPKNSNYSITFRLKSGWFYVD